MPDDRARSGRSLPLWGFLAIVVVYLLIVQGVGLLLAPEGTEYGELPDGNTIWRAITLPVGLSVLFGVVVVSVLGWWRPVAREDRSHRVQRWVWVVPALLLVSILVVTNYGRLADAGAGLVALLAVSTLLVGIGEELMFRGVGVVTLRRMGLTEGKVALWSSLIFGAVHATNLLTEGAGAFVQVVVVSVTGYFLYLARRVAGTIVVPMLLHGLYDFSLLSSSLGPTGGTSARGLIAVLVNLVLVVIVVARRHHIELHRPRTPAAPPGLG